MDERTRLLIELDKMIANDAPTHELQAMLDKIYPKRVSKRKKLQRKSHKELTKEEREYLFDLNGVKYTRANGYTDQELNEIIDLRFIKQWSSKDIAIEMDRTPGAIKSKIRYLIKTNERAKKFFNQEQKQKEEKILRREKQVLDLVREGKTNKEIVGLVPGVSTRSTVAQIKSKYQMILGDKRVKKTVY
ncbi:hypothetical protein SAMN05421839_13910 [Halolactibacillus halophilus]|uniref:Uncharacterized protein n=1 Tax=Halolactibacillus halophilus TaxID=306540 RepID=A0A1I5S4R0_9BACI|nr:hypothetical protein [Halolactibacillus halophilus]GEM02919.1 hypothetical protein HHA03_24510 [Halolactibacillus halophilus]SFP65699.1 hypothetical protein SAMN05421839_13910 [Halolactibacillus halophilus]